MDTAKYAQHLQRSSNCHKQTRKEKKKKTTPFGINLMRSQVSCRDAQGHKQTTQAHSFHLATNCIFLLQNINAVFMDLYLTYLGMRPTGSLSMRKMHKHSVLHFLLTYMWVKLVPVALLLASRSLDMMLLSAGTVSCIPHMAGVSLCSLVQWSIWHA